MYADTTTAEGRAITVYLDGVKQTRCLAADDVEGRALVALPGAGDGVALTINATPEQRRLIACGELVDWDGTICQWRAGDVRLVRG